jgi:hypothetical protein
MSDKVDLDSGGEVENQDPKKRETGCLALVMCLALGKPARDAIRDVMVVKSVREIFVIL